MPSLRLGACSIVGPGAARAVRAKADLPPEVIALIVIVSSYVEDNPDLGPFAVRIFSLAF